MNSGLSSIPRQDSRRSKYVRVLQYLALYLIPSTILALTGLLLFGSAGRDDAHLTYWPAYTLSHYGQILNYNGDRIEQSSSLLQVVLLAILAKFTSLELVTLGKVSSIAFGIASVVAIFNLAKKAADRTAGFFAAIITAASPYFVYWSYGGLESTLASFTGISLIVTISDYLSDEKRPSLLWPALAMILFELVRPETPLLLGCLLAGAIAVVLLKKRFSEEFSAGILLSRMRVLFGIYAITSCVIFAFRLLYFGSLFPQPVSAKSDGFSLSALKSGILYIKKSIIWGDDPTMTVLTVAISIGALTVLVSQIRARKLNFYIVFSLLYVAGYMSFVVFSGGDWMEGGRFLVPFLPVAIALIPLALVSMTESKPLLALVILLFLGIETRSMIAFAQNSSTGIPLWSQAPIERRYDTSKYSWFEKRNRINLRDVPITDHLDYLVTQIANRHHRPVVIMSGQMGMVTYHIARNHFGEVRFIDRLGLADRTFTDCKVTQALTKLSVGLSLSYDFYFHNFALLEQMCQQAKPDIIFDILGSPFPKILAPNDRKEIVANNGYTVIYSQIGNVMGDVTWLKGFKIPADAFIAVRTDILDSLDELQPILVEFSH